MEADGPGVVLPVGIADEGGRGQRPGQEGGAVCREDPSLKALSDSGPLRGPGIPLPAPPSLTPILTVNAVSPPCSTLSAANCFDWESARRLNAIDFAPRAASIFKFPIDPSPKSP